MKSSIFGTLIVGAALLMAGCQSAQVAEWEACFDELSAEHPWAHDQLSWEGCDSLDRRTQSSYPSRQELALIEPAFEKASECNALLGATWQSQGIDAQLISDLFRQHDDIEASFVKGDVTYGEYCTNFRANHAAFEARVSEQRYAEKAEIMEESDQKSLACISAGGRPIYDRRYDLIGDSELVYERCVANVRQAPQSQPTWDLMKGVDPPEPLVFEPRDRGQRCNTSCNSSGNCTTTCSPR